MIGGVSFQPGADYGQRPNGEGRPSGGSGVQEAIRILSLRLPRVVGAQSVAPMPLLTSMGSGGDPRIDRLIDQVMSRMLPPQSGSPAPVMPGASGMPGMSGFSGPTGPTFSGPSAPPYQRPAPPEPVGRPRRAPHVSLGTGPGSPPEPVQEPPSIDYANPQRPALTPPSPRRTPFEW